jgi:hypothetical protein
VTQVQWGRRAPRVPGRRWPTWKRWARRRFAAFAVPGRALRTRRRNFKASDVRHQRSHDQRNLHRRSGGRRPGTTDARRHWCQLRCQAWPKRSAANCHSLRQAIAAVERKTRGRARAQKAPVVEKFLAQRNKVVWSQIESVRNRTHVRFQILTTISGRA